MNAEFLVYLAVVEFIVQSTRHTMDSSSDGSFEGSTRSIASDYSEYVYSSDSDIETQSINEEEQDRPTRLAYSYVGTHRTLDDAQASMNALNIFAYTYVTRYETASQYVRMYRCRSHEACEHRVKIVVGLQEDVFRL